MDVDESGGDPCSAIPESGGEATGPSSPPDSRSPELDRFVEELYAELKILARRALKRERAGHTLQATALAHEAYLQLARQRQKHWVSKAYVLGAAASVVRRLLVDHARSRGAQKRGRGWAVCDLGMNELHVEPSTALLDVHEALERLALLNGRQARIVELRFFGGLDVCEVSSALGVSPRTVANDWRIARAWMRRQLSAERADGR